MGTLMSRMNLVCFAFVDDIDLGKEICMGEGESN